MIKGIGVAARSASYSTLEARRRIRRLLRNAPRQNHHDCTTVVVTGGALKRNVLESRRDRRTRKAPLEEKRTHVPIHVKRALWLQAFGRCQYLHCDVQLLNIDPGTGAHTDAGYFAHIIPVGDGPRAAFRGRYPKIDVNGVANLLYLCGHHHTVIDKTEVDKHPPALLFAMKTTKSVFINEGISSFLHTEYFLGMELADLRTEFEVSKVLNALRLAREAGPLRGRGLYLEARKAMAALLKNPFVATAPAVASILDVDASITELFVFYKIRSWQRAFKTVIKVAQKTLPVAAYHRVCTSALVLARDEFQVLQVSERLRLVSTLIRGLDRNTELSGGMLAYHLLLKSALLRWRGRLERGSNQRSTYFEAKRCANRSYELSGDPGCVLQDLLVDFYMGMALRYDDSPGHQAHFAAAFEKIEREDLQSLQAAREYKARLYRDTYHFDESIESFWAAARTASTAAGRDAYVLAEAVVGKHYHTSGVDEGAIDDALSTLVAAIESGHDHARNIAAYIVCRAIRSSSWFEEALLARIFAGDEMQIDWLTILAAVQSVVVGPVSDSDTGFGIDEAEFWNSIAETTERTLGLVEKARKVFNIAERHAEVTGGVFRAALGLARLSLLAGDQADFSHYMDRARSSARSHQALIVDELADRAKTLWKDERRG